MSLIYSTDTIAVHHGDALAVLASLPDSSVHAVITDPPYFRAIDEPWDKAWDTPVGFTDWLREVAEQWARVLTPNGTLYCFASPQMAARVELHAIEPAGFLPLNRIVWHKTDAKIHRANRDSLTQFHSGDNERILMAAPLKEHVGAKDARNAYANALHALSARVYAPIREYLAAERDRAGFTNRQVDDALGYNGMASHWFDSSQWFMPNRTHYARLRDLFNRTGEYEYLRTEYEYLRTEYEDLRRPFDLGPESALRPRGEVWRFAPTPTRQRGRNAHPCEKPQPLLRHIVETSTRPGQVVLDSFTGSGAVGVAAVQLGREFIGCDLSEHWAAETARNVRVAATEVQGVLL